LILQHLDGEHDRASLTALIESSSESGSAESGAEPLPLKAEECVEQLLKTFAQGALLIA
jgi:hypothetical protein